ncbi:MAG: adenosylcobinamide-GDP ribazoletransferase [Chloroflexi bacterium]|nr:adenosylcobinamide-GDP ribazoletransferase [Chloroflexota bacterium]
MGLLTALRFLTALPLPQEPPDAPPERFGRALAWFPLVGALLGLTLAVLDWTLRQVFPLSVVNGLLLLAGALLTGGLHLDGLADACDGLFARADPARRLEIMRDSRVGGFGVAGVACVLLVQYGAFSGLAPEQRGVALVLAGLLSRWAMVQAVALFPYARPVGLGRAFKDGAQPLGVAAAVLTAAAGAALLLSIQGLLVALAVTLACWLLGRWALTRLPGLTGDVYGAIGAVCEVLTLVLLTAS